MVKATALLLYLDAANATAVGQPAAVIYADNAPLARYLTDTFNQHFDGWKDLALKRPLFIKHVLSASRIHANFIG